MSVILSFSHSFAPTNQFMTRLIIRVSSCIDYQRAHTNCHYSGIVAYTSLRLDLTQLLLEYLKIPREIKISSTPRRIFFLYIILSSWMLWLFVDSFFHNCSLNFQEILITKYLGAKNLKHNKLAFYRGVLERQSRFLVPDFLGTLSTFNYVSSNAHRWHPTTHFNAVLDKFWYGFSYVALAGWRWVNILTSLTSRHTFTKNYQNCSKLWDLLT